MQLLDFFEFDFLRNALLASLFLSVAFGLLSPFVIARRFAYIGSAISHSTLLGLSVGLIFFGFERTIPLFLTMFLVTLIPVTVLSFTTLKERLPSDSQIGIFLSVSMALAITIYALFSKERGDLLSLLFGNILFLSTFDLLIIALVATLIFISIFVPLKKWLYFITDIEGAKLSGIRTDLFHLLFLYLLTLLIVSSIKMVGPILVESYLILPGFTALKMGKSVRGVLIFSVIFSLASSLVGLILANLLSLPVGATITLTQFMLLICVLLIRRLK